MLPIEQVTDVMRECETRPVDQDFGNSRDPEVFPR